MDEQSTPQTPAVLLSREELLVVLASLEAGFIPGLDPDPLGELTPDGRELALTVARRALQARELAQVEAEGELLINKALLAAVGACAYAQSAVVAYHWAAGAATAERFYGHLRQDQAVAHTRPGDILHRFAVLPSRAALIAHLLDFCELGEAGLAQPVEFAVQRAGFARARESAQVGDVDQAASTLADCGAVPEQAGDLARTLAAPPHVSVLQALRQGSGQEVQARELTLLQAPGGPAWSMMPASGRAEELLVSATTRQQVAATLAGWL